MTLSYFAERVSVFSEEVPSVAKIVLEKRKNFIS